MHQRGANTTTLILTYIVAAIALEQFTQCQLFRIIVSTNYKYIFLNQCEKSTGDYLSMLSDVCQ